MTSLNYWFPNPSDGNYLVHVELFCRKTGKEEEGKGRKVREPRRRAQEAEKPDDGEWETIQRKQTKVLNKQEIRKQLFGKEVDEIDHAVIKEKRDDIVGVRKKTIDRSTNIENLKLLLQFSKEASLGVGIEIMLLVDIISVIYEIPSAAACMKNDLWERFVGVATADLGGVVCALSGDDLCPVCELPCDQHQQWLNPLVCQVESE